LCVFIFLSLPEFLNTHRLNLFYRFLKNPLTLIVNFNEFLRSQLNKVCEVNSHPLASACSLKLNANKTH
jgi:hypothetical protein